MVYLDIVNTHVGRLYHERQGTVVGCTVESDAQWTFPISLHYQYSLLTPADVSRFTRALPQPSKTDSIQTVRAPKVKQETRKSHSLPRLTFAPQHVSGDAQEPATENQQDAAHTLSDTASPRDVLIDEHYVMVVDEEDDLRPPETMATTQHDELADSASNDTTESESEEEDAILVAPQASIAVPMVSVIMTTYNCVKYIEHAIRSLQCQTLTNWELVVVDDRSTDGTDQLLRDLAEEDDRIVYLHNQHNVGCYASKNIGIRYARGTWLTFQDADDHSLSQRFEKQLTFCMTGESESSSITRHKDDATAHDACYVVSLARKQKVWTWIPITLFLPLKLFREKLGAFDTVRFGADSEMRKRLQTLRLRVGVLDDYLYACPDRWIELSSRTTSLTGDVSKEPIRELYRAGYMDMHTPLLRTATLSEADARFLRYPFPPFKRQDTHERTHPFPIDGLSKEDGDTLFPSTQEIHANLALYAELQ